MKKDIQYSKDVNFDWTKQRIKHRTKVIGRNNRRKKKGIIDYIRSLLF